MKSKLSMKLLGIVVTIATLASLLVGLTVAPASAAAGTLAYGQISTPSLVNNVLVQGVHIDLVAANLDGTVVFAYDKTLGNLYKSSDGGVTFAAPVAVQAGGIAMAVSPRFGSDNTVVIATGTTVYRSADGGATFYALNLALNGGTITSIDVGNYYSNNALSVLVGLTGSTGASPVLLVNLAQGTQVALGTSANIPGGVLAVKFSPNHANDAEIIAVNDDGAHLNISSIFGNLDWNQTSYPTLPLVASVGGNTAMLAFPSNYRGNTGASFIVGINGVAVPGAYLVTGRHATVGSYTGPKYAGAFYSIAVTDSLAKVYVGLGDGTVQYSTDITDATPTWAGVNNLTGASEASVVVRGSKVICSTAGAEGALNVSADGTNFVQTALINVALPRLADLKVVDNNTMFLLMTNSGIINYLFKTTNGGTSWQRIETIADAVVYMAISPAFATDKTIAYGDSADTTVQMSTDGGTTWTTFNTGAVTTAFAVGTGGTMYTGGAGANFYQVGRWSNATGLAGTVESISISPKDGNKIAVGNDAGQVFVSTDAGATFAEVLKAAGTSFSTAEVVSVAYGPDGTLYAAGQNGCWGFIASDWLEVAAVTNTVGHIVSAPVVSTNGTVYAADYTASAGIWRNLTPTGANEQQKLGASFGLTTGAALFALQVVSATTGNTIYALDSVSIPANYVYAGELWGFSDTLNVVTKQATPADKAVLTTVDTATLTWTAVTGAYSYDVQVNSASDFSGTGAGSQEATLQDATTYTTTATLTEGSTYYWRVRVDQSADGSLIYGGWSTTQSFVMALNKPEVGTTQYPTNGLMDVPVNPTFTWPLSDVTGATYEFVLAEGGAVNDVSNPFLIQDFAASTVTNALPSRETLKYDTQYYWEVRTVTGSSKSAWTVSEFTTVAAPVVPSSTTTVPPVTTIIVPTQPVATPTVTIINSGTTTQAAQPIPSYLLWAVIAVGAILVIAVIVLIVRTRRIP